MLASWEEPRIGIFREIQAMYKEGNKANANSQIVSPRRNTPFRTGASAAVPPTGELAIIAVIPVLVPLLQLAKGEAARVNQR